tara:strand:+ start:54 stop:590 length:537 start_codon:yes stop_codon:yes gene_type:complete
MFFCNEKSKKMLYLIGFMGVGKTTIGKQLAKQHNIDFFDIDLEIEKKTNKSISTIFKENGEHYFRCLEAKTLQVVQRKSIVSCGGGLPSYNHNMRFMKKSGVIIYLKASEHEIFIRLSNKLNNRPLIESKNEECLKLFIKKELAKRKPFYEMANYIIETSNLSEQDVLREINSLPLSI